MNCNKCKKKTKCLTWRYVDVEECKHFKPTTQFDRIKAMSVEKMAELLVVYNVDMDCYYIYGGKGRRFYDEDSAISAQIQYLESEVSE